MLEFDTQPAPYDTYGVNNQDRQLFPAIGFGFYPQFGFYPDYYGQEFHHYHHHFHHHYYHDQDHEHEHDHDHY